jgi:hypothetical protein
MNTWEFHRDELTERLLQKTIVRPSVAILSQAPNSGADGRANARLTLLARFPKVFAGPQEGQLLFPSFL